MLFSLAWGQPSKMKLVPDFMIGSFRRIIMKTHKDYGYIWRKYAEKDKSASFRQRDQFIYLKDLTRFCQNVQHLFKLVASQNFKFSQKWTV